MPRNGGRKVMPLKDRFMSFVKQGDNCWEWTGETSNHGYGVLLVTLDRNKRRLVRTHRLSWELHYGPIPDGQCVLHRCDNPPCVRPDHLFLGTQVENLNDMWTKGRGRTVSENDCHGEKSHMARVTAKTVIEIRRRHSAGDSPKKITAEMDLPISIHGVKAICSRKTWKHL